VGAFFDDDCAGSAYVYLEAPYASLAEAEADVDDLITKVEGLEITAGRE
jgi:hypothetical protein